MKIQRTKAWIGDDRSGKTMCVLEWTTSRQAAYNGVGRHSRVCLIFFFVHACMCIVQIRVRHPSMAHFERGTVWRRFEIM